MFKGYRVLCALLSMLPLRNYGDYLPLTTEIALRDTSNRLMILPNSRGDLPIHVASSIGVSLDSLRFDIYRTAAAMRHWKALKSRVSEIKGLMLTKNSFGYTPVDLEWLNYVEPGSGLLSARTYCSFQTPEGIRLFQHDDHYKKLLRDTVDQVLCIRSDPATLSQDKDYEARRVFGSLIGRITLIISSTSSMSFPRDPEGPLLHDACKLVRRTLRVYYLSHCCNSSSGSIMTRFAESSAQVEHACRPELQVASAFGASLFRRVAARISVIARRFDTTASRVLPRERHHSRSCFQPGSFYAFCHSGDESVFGHCFLSSPPIASAVLPSTICIVGAPQDQTK
eukprot:scaffold7328_cov145-Cylindrotheca_fusiformis.AAC.2